MTESPVRVEAGQPDAAPSGNVHPKGSPRIKVRWYTCVADRIAEVPHLIERHAWHLMFSPDPMSVKLGLSWYAKPEIDAAYRHRRRVTALACMLRRIEAGGRAGGRAERRLSRSPILLTEEQVAEARRLVQREVMVERNPLALSPRAFGGSFAFLLPIAPYAAMFVQACRVGAGWLTLVSGLAAALFVIMNVLCWSWRQGYREAMWQSMQAEATERAELERAQRAELEAECDLAMDLPARPKGERYVYVLGFSTGAVKVGQTFDPARRIREHRRDAAAFNVNLVSFWVSPAHKNYPANEAVLIAGCLAISPSVRKEYFPNLAYADAIKVACGLTFYSADLSGRSIRGGRQ